MILSHYGKKFLNYYNKKENKNLTPKQFFLDVYHPLFFTGEKELVHVQNSPFSNPSKNLGFFISKYLKEKKIEWKKDWFKGGVIIWDKITNDTTKNDLLENIELYKKNRSDELLELFIEKTDGGYTDASLFIGGYASDKINEKTKEVTESRFTQKTSFNIPTHYNYDISPDDIYCSWIANSLAIGIKGINLIFDDPELLYTIFKGWETYHNLCNKQAYKDFKGKQIQTWNSNWLNNELSKIKQSNFNPFNNNFNEKDGVYSLNGVSWLEVVYGLSNKKPNQTINVYTYIQDKMNTTYGITLIKTSDITNFFSYLKNVLGDNEYINSFSLYNQIYGSAYSFSYIIENFGIIGLTSLKPELIRLEELRYRDKNKKNKLYKEIKENPINHKLYNTYLMAQLNLKDIEQTARDFAQTMHNINTKSRKNNHKMLDDLLGAKNKTSFLEEICKAVEVCKDDNLVDEFNSLNDLMKFVLENENNVQNIMLLIRYNYSVITFTQS